MEQRTLGRAGVKASSLCMGTMQFGWTANEKTSFDVLDAAYDAGINFIDTADIYSRWIDGNPGGVSESIIGKWLRKNPEKRAQIILATKVRGRMGDGPNDEGLSRKHIFSAVEESLRRLGTDYIDLYQVHWPDEGTEIEETLRALDDLVRDGRVLYIGCSNFSAWRLVESLWTSNCCKLTSFVSLQPHYNLVHRDEFERELEDVCLKFGIGVIPYSPLAGGFLTGKYASDQTPPEGSRGAMSDRIQTYLKDPHSLSTLEVVKQIALERKKSPSQVALRWLISRPAVVSAIIGPRDLKQLEDNLGSLTVELTDEDMQRLDEGSAWRG
ncbi:MAG: aldo/keto reductase [Anaerolineales bacterium]|nr:aldo/keto reductase [Anaerolineales bacterium]